VSGFSIRRRLLCGGIAGVILLAAAGCGSSSSSSNASGSGTGTVASTGSGKKCTASFGHVGPLTGPAAPLGQEQLHWDEMAVANFNQQHGTNFTLVQGDDQLKADQGLIVARQFVSNPQILAVVGPADTQSVESGGPIFDRAQMAMVSMSAIDTALTSGQYPDFFRVNASNSTEIPLISNLLISKLHAKNVMVVDDQSPNMTQLADGVQSVLSRHGVTVDRESVPPSQTDFSSLVTKITAKTDAVVLAWEVAANGEQFAQQMAAQGKKATIVGSNGLDSPQEFTPNGAYVASFAPDIRFIPGDKQLIAEYTKQYGKFGTYGPPTYAAAMVVMTAIDAVCKTGQTPTRPAVLAAIRRVYIPNSVLGYPLHFNSHGDDPDAKFVLFHIVNGKYLPTG
jgi:branched-chain amino acid transport system substrate-binding protein